MDGSPINASMLIILHNSFPTNLVHLYTNFSLPPSSRSLSHPILFLLPLLCSNLSSIFLSSLYFSIYPHILEGEGEVVMGLTIQAYLILLCFKILHFLQTESLWQPCAEQVYLHHFSNTICSLHVSASHFVSSHNISIFFHYICYGNLSSVIFDVTIVIVLACLDLCPCVRQRIKSINVC